MKRTLSSMNLAALLALIGFTAWLPAQQEKDKAANPTEESASASEGDEAGEGKKPTSEEGQARRTVATLTKLREKMEAKLELTDDQKKAIRPLFEEQIKELKATATRKPSEGEKDPKGDEMAELREKLNEAQKNSDRDGINEIRKQMRDLRRERRQGIQKGTSVMLKKVSEKLNEEQKEEFEEMVKELGLDIDSPSAEVSVQQMFRAVLNPEVGLSNEQRTAVLMHMRSSIEGMDAETRDSRDLDELAGQLRADLRKELTPDQWKKVEELLKADAEKNAAERARNADRDKAGSGK